MEEKEHMEIESQTLCKGTLSVCYSYELNIIVGKQSGEIQSMRFDLFYKDNNDETEEEYDPSCCGGVEVYWDEDKKAYKYGRPWVDDDWLEDQVGAWGMLATAMCECSDLLSEFTILRRTKGE